MAKRFKFKISRFFVSFKSCRSKDPSSLPIDPHRRVPAKPFRSSSFKRQLSSAFRCGIGRGNFTDVDRTETSPSPLPSPSPPTPRFHWENQGKWHVIARVHEEEEEPRRKIYHGQRNDGVSTHSTRDKKRQRVHNKTSRRARFSTSSASESGIDVFTEHDDREETESLIPSSRSFSAEESSSDMPCGTRRSKNHRKPPKRCVSKRRNSVSSGEAEVGASPARLSRKMVRRLVPCVSAVVVEGVVVVKRSADPYEDFKGSMAEMIVEKKLFEAAELEQLLRCFLTLNSRRHHRAIITAFTEIWETLFTGGRSRRPSSVRLSDYV